MGVKMLDQISWEAFDKIDMRVGEVIKAEVHGSARKPAYVLHIDFGPGFGVKKSSSQLTHLYKPEELVGRQVVAVVNLPPKQVGPLISECLVLGFQRNAEEVVLCSPERPVPLGIRLV